MQIGISITKYQLEFDVKLAQRNNLHLRFFITNFVFRILLILEQ